MKKKNINQLIVQQMIRTSNVILHLRNSRAELAKASSTTRICIVDGKPSHEFHSEINELIIAQSMLEFRLKTRISKLCSNLEGFDGSIMDPINFISTYDMKQKVVDLVRNTTYVGYLDLTSCEINIISEENTDSKEEQN